MGGHGYSAFSGLSDLFANYIPSSEFTDSCVEFFAERSVLIPPRLHQIPTKATTGS
jgi:hypothetical protein